MRDEKFIYIKNMRVDGKVFTNMLAVMGKAEKPKSNEIYFIMPFVVPKDRRSLGLHNTNGEECKLAPYLEIGRYSVIKDHLTWTDKNYVVINNISSILER